MKGWGLSSEGLDRLAGGGLTLDSRRYREERATLVQALRDNIEQTKGETFNYATVLGVGIRKFAKDFFKTKLWTAEGALLPRRRRIKRPEGKNAMPVLRQCASRFAKLNINDDSAENVWTESYRGM